jgi:hypothetical protein
MRPGCLRSTAAEAAPRNNGPATRRPPYLVNARNSSGSLSGKRSTLSITE